MTTSNAPTWAAETSAPAWRLSDALWVRWMADARTAWNDGRSDGAMPLWREAQAMSETFDAADPRRAASLHVCAIADGGTDGFVAALAAWEKAEAWVETMGVVDGARSSLFHQRLEAKHRGAYPEIVRHRHRKTLTAGRAATEACLAARHSDTGAMTVALETRREAFGHRESEAAAMAAWLGQPVTERLVDRFAERPPPRPDDEARLYAAALLAPVVLKGHDGR